MTEPGPAEGRAPRILRLSFIRPPPKEIALGRPFRIVFNVTDDLGEPAFGWGKLKVTIRALSLTRRDQYSCNITGKLADSGGVMLESAGPQAVDVTLRASSQTKTSFVHIWLEADGEPLEEAHDYHKALLRFVGSSKVYPGSPAFIILPVQTILIDVSRGAIHHPGKVDTFIRTFQSRYCPLEMEEMPHAPGGLGIGGGRVWDASIALASFLDHAQPEWTLVIELGAGCGLVTAVLALQPRISHLIATDLEETVDGPLTASLTNTPMPPSNRRLYLRPLRWGEASFPTVVPEMVADPDAGRLLIVAADVLYNPDSHDALLTTIFTLLEMAHAAGKSTSECLIAYRPRTEGDDAFFAKARERRLDVVQVAEMAPVSIWRLRRSSDQGTATTSE